VTDTENYIDKDIEILSGIHHLTNSSYIYNNNSTKLGMRETSIEKRIEDAVFEDFKVECCNAFEILR